MGMKVVLVAMAFLITLLASAAAAASESNCDLVALLPCLPAVAGDKPTEPTEECCSVVRVVDPDCICTHVGEVGNLEIDTHLAAELPKKCGRHVPKGFMCGDVPIPSS